MKIYVRDYNCNKKYFDTLNDAVKYIRRYSKPGGNTKTIWVEDSTGRHAYARYRKSESGKLIELKYDI